MNNIRAYNSQNLSLIGGMDNPFFWEEVILSLPIRNDLLTFFPTSSCFSSSCKTRTTELQLVRMVGAYVSLVSLTPTEGWEPCKCLSWRLWRMRMEDMVTLHWQQCFYLVLTFISEVAALPCAVSRVRFHRQSLSEKPGVQAPTCSIISLFIRFAQGNNAQVQTLTFLIVMQCAGILRALHSALNLGSDHSFSSNSVMFFFMVIFLICEIRQLNQIISDLPSYFNKSVIFKNCRCLSHIREFT